MPSVIAYYIKCNGNLSWLQCPRIHFSNISATWQMTLFPATSSSSSAGDVTKNWMLQIIDGHVTLVSRILSRTLYCHMFSKTWQFSVHMWAHIFKSFLQSPAGNPGLKTKSLTGFLRVQEKQTNPRKGF